MNFSTFRQMSILWSMLIVSDLKSRRLNSQVRGKAMVKISSLRKSIYLLQNIRKLRKIIGFYRLVAKYLGSLGLNTLTPERCEL